MCSRVSSAERLLQLDAVLIGGLDDESLVRQQLGGDLRSSIDDIGVDEEAIPDAIEERIAKGGFAALAAEDAIRVEHHPALCFPWVAGRAVGVLQVVLRGRRQAEFVTHKIFEHRASVAANGAVGLVRDDEVEVSR